MSDLVHVSAANLPIGQAVTSYLSLRDQGGLLWYLFIDTSGSPVLTDQRPTGMELASRQVFSWLRWLSPDGTAWYWYPSPFGTVVFSEERPGGDGTGTVYPQWWSPARQLWNVALSNAPALVITGDGIPQLPVEHSVLACRTCHWVGHLDRSNARRDAEGNLLVDRCPVDGTLFYPEDDEADPEWY